MDKFFQKNIQQCCAFCDSKDLLKILDFGDVALAGGFLRQDQFMKEQFYKLRLYFCNECFAIQVVDKVDENILFKDYFYFSSSIKTLVDHFTQYAEELTNRFLTPESSSVLEIGCNDGVLLRPLADQNIKTVIGVDPATNIVSSINDERITIINDFFSQSIAKYVLDSHGHVDLVMANNVYAHIPNIQGITRAIYDVLAPNGVFVFEVHYLGSLIDEFQYDMIYHEHLYYYSLLSATNHFERYGMVIFDVELVPIHAGSIRFYVCKKDSLYSSDISQRVEQLRKKELAYGYNTARVFQNFAISIFKKKQELMKLLNSLRSGGKKIAGYGASGRANTIIQYCEISHAHLDYIIDDAPAKIGYYTPGSHFKVISSVVLRSQEPPDYILLFAWSFLDEIVKRNPGYISGGGKIIIPLPEVRIINS